MTESEESDIDIQRVRQAMIALGEHFDTVQIFTTRYEPESDHCTVNRSLGSGNWFSRYGQVKEWVVKCDEEAKQHVRKRDLE